MKFELKKWICVLLVGSFLGFSSCGDDDTDDLIKIPETPTNPSSSSESPKDFIFSSGYSWSAVAYHDVTLAEIHSTVSDYSLSCNPPEGYTLQLRKLPSKDDAGYNVYRIVCDMEAVTQTTSSNENVKLEIPYTLTGNYVSNGVTKIWNRNGNCHIQRFFAPSDEANEKIKSNFWYLAEYQYYENLDWVTFESQDKYYYSDTPTYSYSSESSPIRKEFGWDIVTGINPDGSEYHEYGLNTIWRSSLSLPGWIESKAMALNCDLIDTRFSFKDYPDDFGSSVYLVTDEVVWCMKAVYSESDELEREYHYKFMKYEPEVPEKPYN